MRSGVPQGSVLGPVLFLVYIADLQLGDEDSKSKILKFVDDSKVLTRSTSEEDVANLQEELVHIYGWASRNHMRWNDLKFQVLRLGSNMELKQDTIIFSPDYGEIVEAKEVIKDLGILVDDKLSYTDQLFSAVAKAKQKSAWVLRTFSTRKVSFLRTMWQSLIQCHLDYGCILWAPYDSKSNLRMMESVLRAFTRKGKGQNQLTYWERLRNFNLNSTQRRVERYRILYCWKSLNGLAPSLGLQWSDHSGGRSGRTLRIPKIQGVSESLKNLRRKTIQAEGVRLMNVLPGEIRNFSGDLGDFKSLLDSYLGLVPDQPETEWEKPGVCSSDGKFSNSVYDWIVVRGDPKEWKPPTNLTSCGFYFKLVKPSQGKGTANALLHV